MPGPVKVVYLGDEVVGGVRELEGACGDPVGYSPHAQLVGADEFE